MLKLILDETEMIEKLRAKRDPQDEARAENLEELVSVAREFDVRNPGVGLLEFLTEVSLVAAADDLDDEVEPGGLVRQLEAIMGGVRLTISRRPSVSTAIWRLRPTILSFAS